MAKSPAKRGYIGGFCWAIFGDSGDDGTSWPPLIGLFVGGALGWLSDRFIAPCALTVPSAFLGLVVGAAVVAILVADEPRQQTDDERD